MIEKLQPAFNDITYHDGQHRYFHSSGKELMSVTKFLGTLKPKFNSDFWTVIKAYEFSGFRTKFIWNDYTKFILYDNKDDVYGTYVYIDNGHSHLKVQPEDVQIQWNLDALVGTTRGTYIHEYLDRIEARVIDVPRIEIPKGLEIAASINYVNSLSVARELCKEFLKYAQENLILITSEFIVGDLGLGLAGRFDRLYFNKLTGEYEIWDFKTDKQIRYKSSFGKMNLFDLPDCEFEKYSLQTSIYRKIIEDRLGISLGESKVVWFNLKDNKYEIIPTTNYVKLITSTLDENNRRAHIQH